MRFCARSWSLAVLAVPAFAADTVINAVSGGSFVTVDGKRVSSVKVFFTNGVIQKTRASRSPRASKVVVAGRRRRSSAAPSGPTSRCEIDDVPVMSAYVEGVKQTLEAPVSLPPGTHVVRVRFDNDYFEPVGCIQRSASPLPLTCDRNLLLDSVELVESDGATTPPPPPPPPPTPAASASTRTGGPGPTSSGPATRRRPGTTLSTGSRWPDNNEWVGYSCQDRSRFSQVTSPVAQGQRAYRIEVDGDDSYGERCELENGNTSSNRLHEDLLFHRGQEVWIAFQTLLPPDFSFAEDGAPVSFPGDGGLLMQLKQLGSCGTPALGIVTGRGQFAMRNSAGNGCESGIDAIPVVGADGPGPLGAVAGPR